MTFILRWPAILVLLALVLLCFAGALGAAGLVADVTAPASGVSQVDAQVAAAQAAVEETGASISWIDVGLLAAAGMFFLISAIRLARKTQGFWTWLLGFALYGGRWAYQQQASEGGALATLQSIDISSYIQQPQSILADVGAPAAQVALLAIVLVVGLFVFIVDAADRSYWDKQGA